VLLDLRHLGAEKIKSKLSQIRALAIDFAGVDPVTSPVPVKPGHHYSMGGIATDKDGRTAIPGLFTAGESACVSVHGANRLGGNSLLETIVFGRRAGTSASEYCKTTEAKPFPESALKDACHSVATILKREEGESIFAIKKGMNDAMEDFCGIFRNKDRLAKGYEKIKELRERYKKAALVDRSDYFNNELLHYLELGQMLDISECILLGAMNREESRGSHFRTDFPKRDDEKWLKHTLAFKENGEFRLDYRDVSVTKFKPEERKY